MAGFQAGDAPANTKPFTVLFLGICYVACSAGMINFNKFLMNKSRFPFAGTICLFHMIFATSFTSVLYKVKPSLFPSLDDPEKRAKIDRNLVFKGALPIAALFSVQLVLTNTAYLHCSVAFLQMMKEANLVVVYVLSLCAALEVFSMRNAGVLLAIIAATFLSIHGEIHFSPAGFAMQATGQLFESSKIVLQAILLSPSCGWKLDALTYVLVVMPLCAICLATTFGSLVYFWPSRPADFGVPGLADIAMWWPFLLGNCALAFVLNVVVALFVKNSGAVAFILAGILKDVMIVAASSLVMGETVSSLQVEGFTMQIFLVLLWSLMKVMPEKFERGIPHGLYTVAMGLHLKGKGKAFADEQGKASSAEQAPLLENGAPGKEAEEDGVPAEGKEENA